MLLFLDRRAHLGPQMKIGRALFLATGENAGPQVAYRWGLGGGEGDGFGKVPMGWNVGPWKLREKAYGAGGQCFFLASEEEEMSGWAGFRRPWMAKDSVEFGVLDCVPCCDDPMTWLERNSIFLAEKYQQSQRYVHSDLYSVCDSRCI